MRDNSILTPLHEQYRADYKDYEEKGYIDSYYGGFFYRSEEFLNETTLALIVRIQFDEQIVPDKLQEALDKTLLHCPFLNYEIKILKEQPKIRFIKRTEPLVIEKGTFPEHLRVGDDRLYTHISYDDDWVYISMPHVITDFNGIKQVFFCLQDYYYCGKTSQPVPTDNSFYAADLMRYELPVRNGIKYDKLSEQINKINKTGNIFKVPEAEEPYENTTFYIQFDAAPFREFLKKNNLTRQTGVSVLLAMAIQRVHPENDKTIRIRGAVDTRSIYGIEGSFQNASMPHIYLDISPEMFGEKLPQEALKLKDSLNEQTDYDYITCFTNRCGECVRNDDVEKKRELISEYINMSEVFASSLGSVITKQAGAHIKNGNYCRIFSFPIMLYMIEASERNSFSLLQQFNSDVYKNALIEILREEGITIF